MVSSLARAIIMFCSLCVIILVYLAGGNWRCCVLFIGSFILFFFVKRAFISLYV